MKMSSTLGSVFQFTLGTLALICMSMTEATSNVLQYTIATTWDGDRPADDAQIHLKFSAYNTPVYEASLSTENTTSVRSEAGLLIEIDAPFYNDPVVPSSLPVGSTDKLWNYEVVEVFFLSESEGKYLETEFAPKGHYLLLQLDSHQTVLEYQLPLNHYTAKINTDTGRWHGRAVIPWEYLPNNVNKFNAYAIHRSDPNRVYMSLFPTLKGKYDGPSFHRLAYFQPLDMHLLWRKSS